MFLCLPFLLSYQSCQLPQNSQTKKLSENKRDKSCLENLCPTMGHFSKVPHSHFYKNESSQLRAYLHTDLPDAYQYPFSLCFKEVEDVKEKIAFLSGELRKQIGIKLYARNSCNVLYIMWRMGDSPSLVISYKYNPQDQEHRECGNHGYTTLQHLPIPLSALKNKERSKYDYSQITVFMKQQTLHVYLNGLFFTQVNIPSFVILPQSPEGVRIDNGHFLFYPKMHTALNPDSSANQEAFLEEQCEIRP
jgi:hypothetical protein